MGYRFEEVQSVTNASSEHQATGREQYKMFVDECLELSTNKNVYVTKDYLHRAYNSWCDLVLGKSTYGREKLTNQAGNIKEYLGELGRANELTSHLNIEELNRSGAGDGPFKRRQFKVNGKSERVHALYCVRLSSSGLNHLRSSFKGEPLPDDIPREHESSIQRQGTANIIRGRFNEQD